MSVAFAHGKPFPHSHIGFLHPEEVLIVGVVLALVFTVFLLTSPSRS